MFRSEACLGWLLAVLLYDRGAKLHRAPGGGGVWGYIIGRSISLVSRLLYDGKSSLSEYPETLQLKMILHSGCGQLESSS